MYRKVSSSWRERPGQGEEHGGKCCRGVPLVDIAEALFKSVNEDGRMGQRV